MKHLTLIASTLIVMFLIGCNSAPKTKQKKFSDKELENIVRHSYQYVAMYNVINNFAMKKDHLFYTHGWNNTYFGTKLSDHTAKAIARPNNDTYYIISTLDLRDDAIVINYPAFNSKYVSLEVAGYDHYVEVPLATSKGDFKKPVKVLYYTDRTKNYHGEPVDGVDTVLKMTSDFVVAFLRLAPHISDKERSASIKKSLEDYKLMTLSEFQGKPPVKVTPVKFPPFGTDQYVFKNDFLEVMQFIFNHVTFDPNDPMDKEVLEIFAPLGVKPGLKYDPSKVAKLDGERLAKIAARIAKESLAIWNSPDNPYIYKVFQPKGKMSLDAMVIQSAVGPIGLPASQALYPGIGTDDGKPLNSMHDYVIHMSKDELPPAKAFWSFTLYDAKNGYFIPNDRKKYTVGENGGMKLNKDGGIDVYIAAKKPQGVPEENWLPINRDSTDLDVILRIYAPDTAKMKNWTPPKAVMIK
jgi:hypothetical protein